MALNAKEFCALVEQHRRTGESSFPPIICGCGCGKPITPTNDQPDGPQYMVIDGKTVRVSADCYFDAWGDNNVVTPRRSRGA